jgi:hypothetical protein
VGFQDIGTQLDAGTTTWTQTDSSDSGSAVIGPNNPNDVVHTYANAPNPGMTAVPRIFIANDGGNTWTSILSQLATPFANDHAVFYPPLAGDPSASSPRFLLGAHFGYSLTFDTCQGEEREVILYRMVATDAHDALNYVFPVVLTDADEKVEDALKFQRLNVRVYWFNLGKDSVVTLSARLSQMVDSAPTGRPITPWLTGFGRA